MNENEPRITENTVNVEPVNTTNVVNNVNNFGQGAGMPKKKSGILFIIIPVILILALVAGAAIWYMNYTKPENFYKRLISSALDSYLAEGNETEAQTQKNTIKLDADIDLEDEEFEGQEIINLINDLKIEVGTQTDKQEKKLVVNLKADYQKDELLDVQVFADSKNKETYLYAKEYINKYLEVELEDENYSELDTIYENLDQEKLSLRAQKAIKLLKDEYENMIKPEYCSSEKVNVKINNEDVKTTKHIITMTLEQLGNEITTMLDNVEKNEEILKELSQDDKEEFLDLIEETREEIENSLEDAEEGTIQINVYTTGLTQENVVKFELLAIAEESTLTIACTKTQENEYFYEMIADDESVMSGTIKLEKNQNSSGSIEINAKIEDLGKLTLDIEYSQENNIVLDKIDEENTTSIDELTQPEQLEFMQNLQESKLYELIEDVSSMFMTTGDGYDYEDEDTTFGEDTEGNEDETNSTGVRNIITYGGEIKIAVNLPEGVTVSEYSSDKYLNLKKEGLSIGTITTEMETEDEYYEHLERVKQSSIDMNHYKSVTLSEITTKTVGEITFNYATMEHVVEYESVGTVKNVRDFYWAKISEEDVLVIDLLYPDKLTEQELEEILNVSISKN